MLSHNKPSFNGDSAIICYDLVVRCYDINLIKKETFKLAKVRVVVIERTTTDIDNRIKRTFYKLDIQDSKSKCSTATVITVFGYIINCLISLYTGQLDDLSLIELRDQIRETKWNLKLISEKQAFIYEKL
ncbi:hypothetical protein BpHYR1_031920 [Brachionus plicatilis]|uniref:Uncharacterized protein n=1 Tax=Brachionus plicatilis TaxID=10195 RepID=A0A3M7SHS3_BRAPC|nr:hypothetical protein BpHYR1_031920 [Brachionus plicatilis]